MPTEKQLEKAKQNLYKGGIRKIPSETKVVAQVADMICEGKNDESVLAYLESQGICRRKGRAYITAALDYMFPEGLQAQRDEILEKNAKDLMQIVGIGMHDHRYLKEANAAIRELNRMIGVGNGTTIAVQTDTENNTSQVVIKFDGQ